MPFARSRKSQNPPPERARARRDTHSFDAERISIVGAELLRGDAADDARRFIDIADVAEVMIAGDGEAPAPRGTEGYLASPFCLLIGEPVPAASGNGEPCSEPLRQSSAKCEAFDTIYPEKIVSKATHLALDRKSTRLNSSHSQISYAVFCLKINKASHGASSPAADAAAKMLVVSNNTIYRATQLQSIHPARWATDNVIGYALSVHVISLLEG